MAAGSAGLAKGPPHKTPMQVLSFTIRDPRSGLSQEIDAGLLAARVDRIYIIQYHDLLAGPCQNEQCRIRREGQGARAKPLPASHFFGSRRAWRPRLGQLAADGDSPAPSAGWTTAMGLLPCISPSFLPSEFPLRSLHVLAGGNGMID